MTALELLKDLWGRGISLWVADGRVNFRPSPPAELVQAMKENKAGLLRILEQERQAGTVESFDQAKISELVRRAGYPAEDCGAFRKELHRLVDLADEADRAGDVAGMNRALSTIARLLDGAESAKTSVSGARGGVLKGQPLQSDLPGLSMQPRASNRELAAWAVMGQLY